MKIWRAFAIAATTMAALAQAAWPDKPIRIVVPWAPGGSTDILARTVAQKLTQSLGQPVIVENKPGASANIGSDVVAKAVPDGYTLLFGSMSTHAINPAMNPSMPFRGVEDFTPIALLAYVTNTMVIHPSLPVNNLREFIDYCKANPGKIAYASAGPGSTNHLSAALLEKMTGCQMLHVPYKGGAPAVTDTVGGQTQMFITAGTQSLPHVKAGKLHALAVSSAVPSPLAPDVPTLAKALNRPDLDISFKLVLQAPKATPAPVLAELERAAMDIMQKPEVRARLQASDLVAVGSTMK